VIERNESSNAQNRAPTKAVLWTAGSQECDNELTAG